MVFAYSSWPDHHRTDAAVWDKRGKSTKHCVHAGATRTYGSTPLQSEAGGPASFFGMASAHAATRPRRRNRQPESHQTRKVRRSASVLPQGGILL